MSPFFPWQSYMFGKFSWKLDVVSNIARPHLTDASTCTSVAICVGSERVLQAPKIGIFGWGPHHMSLVMNEVSSHKLSWEQHFATNKKVAGNENTGWFAVLQAHNIQRAYFFMVASNVHSLECSIVSMHFRTHKKPELVICTLLQRWQPSWVSYFLQNYPI